MSEKSNTIKELATALIAAQKELPTILKDKTNPFFKSKYAGLDTVLPAALAVLTKHGLGLIQSIGTGPEGGSTLTTMLVHESGEWYSDTMPLLLSKDDPQGQGSAVTYARRYGTMAMVCLVADEDDDGNAASTSKTPAARRTARPAPARPQGAQRDTPESYEGYQQAAQEAAPTMEGQMAAAREHMEPPPSDEGAPYVMTLPRDGKCYHCRYPIAEGERAWHDKAARHVWHLEGQCADEPPAAETKAGTPGIGT